MTTRGSTSNKLISAFMALLLAVTLIPSAPRAAYANIAAGSTISTAQEDEPTVEITSTDLTAESTSITFTANNLPDGCMAAVAQCAADATPTFMDTGATENIKIMNAYTTGLPTDGSNTVTFDSGTLKEGYKVVVFLTTGYTAANVVATSEPVVVKAAGGTEPPSSDKPTRAEVMAACSVSMTNPTGGTSFKLSDTAANISVKLHERIDFARLTVYAYPKAATFDPDNVELNKSVFSKTATANAASELKDITATFDLSGLDTTYNLVAYVYYQIPEDISEADYQYVTSSAFTLTDEGGQTTESYAYPRASIVEDTLAAGSTALHVSLSGDERLFKLVEDTKGNTSVSDRFSIHFLVVEYAADVTGFSLDEGKYTKLYDEEATAAFTGKEVELEHALTEGKRVRAICYWTQYTGDAAELPVPKSNDYEGDKYGDNSIVVTSGTPVYGSPSVTVDSPITTATTSFTVNVKNLPDGALMFVDRFAAGESIEHQYQNALKMFTGYGDNPAPVNGANTVEVGSGTLSAGDRIVAFILSGRNYVAQSEPVVVTAPASEGGELTISTANISSETTELTVNVACDIPDGALLGVRSFASNAGFNWDDANQTVGVVVSPQRGDNSVSVNGGISGKYVKAFLFADGGKTIYAESEPISVAYVTQAPTCSISPNDSMFTAGDMFVRYSYKVDPNANDVSYKLYQFVGDELNREAATVLASGTFTTSKINYSGNSYFGVGGRLVAGSKVQLVVTADGVEGLSNVLSVAETPAWAKVTPTIAFDQAYVTDDATAVKVFVNYPEGYKELGDEFFCNVTVYRYPGTYTDDDFEDQELDEKPTIAPVIAGMNSKNGETNGALTLKLSENYKLTPGERLMAKVRLPRAEQSADDDSEADYLSMSIPVVSADATIPGEALFVYNLSADTAKGAALREVAASLGLPVTDLAQADLVRQVGAIVGYDGYGEVDAEYADDNPTVEYLLMANLSEASLDRLLAAMSEAGISIGAKGITTDTNKGWALGKLIVDIAEENETVTALVELQQLVNKARALDQAIYGEMDGWADMQSAIAAAEALYNNEDEEPTAVQLKQAYRTLEPLYLSLSGLKKLDGQVAIAAAKQTDGTYTLTASVEGASAEGLAYSYTWNDVAKTQGPVLSGVSADKVGARIVTVTAADQDGREALGKLTAQLSAPAAPTALTLSSNPGRLDVSWSASGKAFNRPAPDSYTVELYSAAGKLVKSPATSKTSVTFTGLAAGTYTVKAYASNIAGRSDKASATATVAAVPVTPSKTDISKAVVTLSATKFAYNNKVQKPTVKSVKLGTKTLPKTAYQVKYSKASSKAVGSYTVTVSGESKNNYIGTTKAVTYQIVKGKNPISAKATSKAGKTYSAKTLKKKAQTYSKAVKVSSAAGKITYSKAAVSLKKYAKYIAVDKKSGAITLKKGTPQGTYKITVKATAAGNSNYKSGSASATVVVKVKK